MTGVVAHYYSNQGYTSGPAASLPSQYFEPRAKQPLFFSQTMVGDRIAGGVVGSTGYLELDNWDGGLDDLLASHAIDGRRVVIKMGRPEDDYDDFESVFDGVATGWSAAEKTVRIDLRDVLSDLDLPIQETTYAGTGGLEGGADVEGKPKPLLFGVVRNISPPLVDYGNQIYQVHDGAIGDVDAVLDRGVAITQVPGAPAPGEYQDDEAAGTFTLGDTPAGQVTADATGAGVASMPDILQDVMAQAGYVAADFHTWDRINFHASGNLGVWVSHNDRASTRDVVNQLLTTVGAFAAGGRTGLVRLGIFEAPGATPDFTLTSAEIMEIEQELPPPGIYPPNWRRQVGHQRNWTVQRDVAAGATDAQRAFAAEEYRVSTAEDAAVKTSHLYATDPPLVRALFASSADADTEAARLLALYQAERRIYRVATHYRVYDYRIGQPGRLDYPRWNLAGGTDCRVVAIDLDAARNLAVLRLFV
jgi:hypothetical protein